LLGDNAQGKTNVLEAIYLMATLRSFRGVGGAHMVRHGQKGYFVGGKVVGRAITISKSTGPAPKKTEPGQPAVRKLTDYLGVLRVVIFCTEDLQLIKGPARARRRFVDLLLTQTQSKYLPLLQRYAVALRSRNALLKQRAPDEAALDSFSDELVRWAMKSSGCARTHAEALAARAAGVPPHFERRGRIAAGIPVEREIGFRGGTGAVPAA